MSARTFSRAFGACVLVALCACSAPAHDTPPALPPVTPIMIPPPIASAEAAELKGAYAWKETQFADGRRVVPAAPERYTLEFMAEGRVALRADCNRGSANFEAGAAGALTFNRAATTKMGCPQGSHDTEFLRELGQVERYQPVDGDLVLTLRAGAGSMRFMPLAR